MKYFCIECASVNTVNTSVCEFVAKGRDTTSTFYILGFNKKSEQELKVKKMLTLQWLLHFFYIKQWSRGSEESKEVKEEVKPFSTKRKG